MQGVVLQERLSSLQLPPDDGAMSEVRLLVFGFVDDRKAAGWPPERVIIAIKEIAREAGLRPSTAVIQRHAPLTTLDEFLAKMVRWSIHRYYGLE